MSVLDLHNDKVHEVAREYRRKGYRVTEEPQAEQLPEFLRGWRPDIIAESDTDSVVIEIKGGNRKTTTGEKWAALAQAVKAQPNWTFRIVFAQDGPNTLPERGEFLSDSDVENRLTQSEQIAHQGAKDAALLFLWSATEAALRNLAERFDVKKPDLRPAALISQCYSDGLMDREDYDFLMASLQTRNAVALGLRQTVTDADLADLHACVRRLLDESPESE